MWTGVQNGGAGGYGSERSVMRLQIGRGRGRGHGRGRGASSSSKSSPASSE